MCRPQRCPTVPGCSVSRGGEDLVNEERSPTFEMVEFDNDSDEEDDIEDGEDDRSELKDRDDDEAYVGNGRGEGAVLVITNFTVHHNAINSDMTEQDSIEYRENLLDVRNAFIRGLDQDGVDLLETVLRQWPSDDGNNHGATAPRMIHVTLSSATEQSYEINNDRAIKRVD
jgi:hypothetical protein